MTDNHYIPNDSDTTTADVPSLPDRSDLSELYFKPKEAKVTIEEQSHALDQVHLSETIREYALKIGLLIPTPFIITIIVSLVFITFVNPGTIYLVLPLMLVWGIGIVWLCRRVMRLLRRIDVPLFTFLSLHISCLMFITPALSYLAQFTPGPDWTALIIISVIMLSMSTIFCWLFLQLILNDSLKETTKRKLIGLIVTTCLASIATYIIVTAA